MISLITRGIAAAALAVALGMANAASAQEGNSPLSAIGRMFGQKPAQQTTGQDEAEGPTTEQVLRIERLEQQIRQLTGTIEQLQYRNQQLENQLRGASAGGVPAAQPVQSQPIQQPGARPPVQAAPMPAPPAPVATGRRSDVFDPSQNPNAPGAPRTLGGPQNEPPPIVTADPPLGAPGGRRAGAPLDLSTLSSAPGSEAGSSPEQGPLPAPPSRNLSATGAVAAVAPPSDTPKDTYDLAYGYVLRKDYALAEDTFHAFLKKYPTDRRAAEAQFWLGESLFQRQRYDAAAQAFLEVSTKHGSHAKAPEALLRLAQSLAAMNQKEMSCATLAEVGRKYPKAPATVKQGVEREQKRVRC
jgi:tol-pal system protein YbgF